MNGTYLYCVLRGARRPSAARAPDGLPGASRPEILPVSGSLWLVLADVPLDVYGSGALEARLSDFEWVGRIALAHEAVVEHFANRPALSVVPMKLFTMFSTRERAQADIAERTATITALMRRIAGAQEWGVRITRAAEPAVPRGSRGRGRASTGAAFLAAKKQARDAANEAKAAGTDAAMRAYRALTKFARESRIRQDAPASAATPPLLDAAFLVTSARRQAFVQAARRAAVTCAKSGALMMLSGPWPAYNFVHEDATPR